MERGIILIWSGTIATIPSGFILCNGANGTPDLRDRFVVGAGTTYNPADTGGAVNHNHTFTTDGHAHFGEPNILGNLTTGTNAWADVETDSGTTNNADGRPPYYSLAFIMKT